MSIGRKLILWNDDRAVRFAHRHGCSPVLAPLFSPVDDLGHWLDRHRSARWLAPRSGGYQPRATATKGRPPTGKGAAS